MLLFTDGLIAGSDVANISTTARREGDVYVVNGAKKWITNGIWADYCTAAVRTGGPGKGGISLLVIPLAAPGVTRRRMYNSGVHASGKGPYISLKIFRFVANVQCDRIHIHRTRRCPGPGRPPHRRGKQGLSSDHVKYVRPISQVIKSIQC